MQTPTFKATSICEATRVLRAAAIFLWLGALICMGGCAQTAEEIAGGAAAEGAGQTLTELNEPQNRQALNELMALPGVADAGESLSRGLINGVIAALGDGVEPEQVEAFARAVMDGVEPALVRLIRGEFEGMGDSLATMSAQLVDAALGEAFDPQTRRQATAFADQLTRTVVRAALQVFADQLRQDLGPALRDLISDEVGAGLAEAIGKHAGPALTETLREGELRQALADSAHTVGKHSVLGVSEGMKEVQQKSPEEGGPLQTLQRTVSQGEDTVQTVLWMLGASVLVLLLIVVVLGLGLWRALAKGGEMIEESKVREESLTEMAHAVTAAEEREDIDKLFARVSEEMGRDDARDFLREKMRQSGLEPPRDEPPRARD